MYDGNDITGGEDEVFGEELVPPSVVVGSVAVPLADWLRLPGVEDVPP